MTNMITAQYDSAGNQIWDPTGNNLQPSLLASRVAAAYADAMYLSKFTHKLDSGAGRVAYSCASAFATVYDCYGRLQNCLSGEAPFSGARRSANLAERSESFTEDATNWQVGGGTAGTLVTQSPYRNPVNNRFATRLTRIPSDGFNMLVLRSKVYRLGKYSFSIWLRGVDGTTSYILNITQSPSTVLSTITVTPPVGVWTRYAVEADITVSGNHFAVLKPSGTSASAQVIDVACAMMKEGLTDEYVPRGVTTIPTSYWESEANTDGVRYFNTLNPWTLSSGVATKAASEVAISESTLIGLRQGPTVTNRVYSSRDVGAAQWTLNNATVAAGSSADDSITLDYRGTRKLLEAATTSSHSVLQAWKSSNPALNSIIAAQALVKAGERSIVYLRVRQLDGATFAVAYFNLVTLTAENVTGTRAEAHIFKPHPSSDLYLIALSCSAGSSGSTAPQIELGITTAAGTLSYLGDGTSGAYFGAVQFTTAEGPTAYTGDTGSAGTLTRAIATIDLYPSNHPTIDFTWQCDNTLWWRSNIETKSAYAYVMYSYKDVGARAGMNLRAGVNGGGWSGSEDDITCDIFDSTYASTAQLDEAGGTVAVGSSLWDGADIRGNFWYPMETINWQWSVGTNPLTGNTNQALTVGGAIAVPTLDSPHWSIKQLSFTPGIDAPITLGRDRITGVPKGGDSFFKNVGWQPTARTVTEQTQVAAP